MILIFFRVSTELRNVNKIIIGNKCDVPPENREVSREQGEELAAKYGVKFFETSAKSNIGVTEAFESITKHVVERLEAEEVGRAGGAGGVMKVTGSQKPVRAGGCC